MTSPTRTSHAALLRALAARWPEASAYESRGELELPLGDARLRIQLGPVDAPRAFKRLRGVSLRYAVEGELGPLADEARHTLTRVVEVLEALERVTEVEDVDALRRALGASARPDAHVRITPSLAARPDLLVEPVIALYEAAVERWWEGPPPLVEGLPECLSLDMRPSAPRRSSMLPPSLTAPCDACAAAFGCSGTPRLEARAQSALRPLRHADGTGATWVALRTTASLFGRPIPEIVERFVHETLSHRRGLASSTPTPFELSIKIADGRLVPALRVVEYSPPHHGTEPSPEQRAERRDAVVRTARALVEAEDVAELDAWLALVARHEVRGTELSIGVDVSLEDERAAALQLYAHVEPMGIEATRALLADALRWSEIEEEAIARVTDELETLHAATGVSPLTLLAYSPKRGARRRQKLYIAAPLALTEAFGETLHALGPLAPFAPSKGLTVLETEGAHVVVRKRDFPSTAHYLASDALVEALASGLGREERARLDALTRGARFAAWPTWLSVGRGVRTFYFVPR